MKKSLLDQEEIEALIRRNEQLNEQTLDLYGGKSERNYLRAEQRAGWIPVALLVCLGLPMAVYGTCGVVRWLVQGVVS